MAAKEFVKLCKKVDASDYSLPKILNIIPKLRNKPVRKLLTEVCNKLSIEEDGEDHRRAETLLVKDLQGEKLHEFLVSKLLSPQQVSDTLHLKTYEKKSNDIEEYRAILDRINEHLDNSNTYDFYKNCQYAKLLLHSYQKAKAEGITIELPVESRLSKTHLRKLKKFGKLIAKFPKLKYIGVQTVTFFSMGKRLEELLHKRNQQCKQIQEFWADDCKEYGERSCDIEEFCASLEKLQPVISDSYKEWMVLKSKKQGKSEPFDGERLHKLMMSSLSTPEHVAALQNVVSIKLNSTDHKENIRLLDKVFAEQKNFSQMMQFFYNYQKCCILQDIYNFEMRREKRFELKSEEFGMSRWNFRKFRLLGATVKGYPKLKYVSWQFVGFLKTKDDIDILLNKRNAQFKHIQDFWAEDYNQSNQIEAAQRESSECSSELDRSKDFSDSELSDSFFTANESVLTFSSNNTSLAESSDGSSQQGSRKKISPRTRLSPSDSSTDLQNSGESLQWGDTLSFSNYDEKHFKAVPNSTKNFDSFKRPLPYKENGPSKKKIRREAVGLTPSMNRTYTIAKHDSKLFSSEVESSSHQLSVYSNSVISNIEIINVSSREINENLHFVHGEIATEANNLSISMSAEELAKINQTESKIMDFSITEEEFSKLMAANNSQKSTQNQSASTIDPNDTDLYLYGANNRTYRTDDDYYLYGPDAETTLIPKKPFYQPDISWPIQKQPKKTTADAFGFSNANEDLKKLKSTLDREVSVQSNISDTEFWQDDSLYSKKTVNIEISLEDLHKVRAALSLITDSASSVSSGKRSNGSYWSDNYDFQRPVSSTLTSFDSRSLDISSWIRSCHSSNGAESDNVSQISEKTWQSIYSHVNPQNSKKFYTFNTEIDSDSTFTDAL